MAGDDSDKPRVIPRNLVGILIFLGRYPWRIIFCVGLLLTIIAIDLMLPQVLGDAITNLRWHVEWAAEFSPSTYVLLFGSLVLIRTGLAWILGPARNRLIQRTLAEIRASIYDALQRLAFQFHDKSNTGELVSRSTADVTRLQNFFFACLFLSLDICVSLVATIFLIFHVSTALGVVTLLTTISTIGLIIFFARKLQPRWRKVHDLHGAMITVIQENIAGVRVVKAFSKEADEISKFDQKRESFIRTMKETVNYWAARVPIAQFIFGLTLPLVLWVGGRQVISGDLEIGDFAKVLFYLMAIGHRVGMIGQFTNILQNASASAERVLEIIHEPRTIKSGQRKLKPGPGDVRFEGVDFRYSEGKYALKNITFHAEPGLRYAIVGSTGSGKTSFVNMIPRFYDPSAGRVLVDGVDVRDLDLMQLRRSVGVIFQETFLFSTTVVENIAYGKPDSDREDIERCARAAQAWSFISELEDGFETIIGERGVTLSGGEKQRIAIARAFLMNPRILILDDATSNVDSQTERLIQEALWNLSAGRTTFIIAHRFSTVQRADKILVMRNGEIVETGTHSELARTGGFYCDLFGQQFNQSSEGPAI